MSQVAFVSEPYLENAIQSQVNYENFAFYSNFSCEYNFCPKTQCILQCSMRMNNCAIPERLTFLNNSKCEPNVKHLFVDFL